MGTAIFSLKRGSANTQKQELGACDSSAANPIMLQEAASKPAHAPTAAPQSEGRHCPATQEQGGAGVSKEQEHRRGVPFYHRVTFLMRMTICAYRHKPNLLLKPQSQRALRQSNLAFLVLGSAVYLAEPVQSLSQVSFLVSQSFVYRVCVPFGGQCQVTLIL